MFWSAYSTMNRGGFKVLQNFMKFGEREIHAFVDDSIVQRQFSCQSKCKTRKHTVDGRNPAAPGMYKTLWIMVDSSYQLVQNFFDKQCGIHQATTNVGMTG